MRLLKLSGANFGSYVEFDLDLGGDGLIAVVGRNGSGKSTLFRAIEWALYGSMRGPSALPVRRDGAPDGARCWVELEFELDGRGFRLHRVDGDTASVVDLETNEDLATTLDGTSRYVTGLLGQTRRVFTGTFYAKQNEVNVLELGRDKDRRRQVELLLGIERLRLATTYAQAEATEQQRFVDGLGHELPDVDELRADVARIELEAERQKPYVEQAETNFKRATTRHAATKKEAEKLQARDRLAHNRRSAAQEAKSTFEGHDRARKELRARVADAEEAAARLRELTPLAETVKKLAERERDLDLLRRDHNQLTKKTELQRQALKDAAKLADQSTAIRLPGTGQDGGLAELADQITATEAEWKELTPSLGQHMATLTAVGQEIEAVGRMREAVMQAAELDKSLMPLADAESDLEAAQERWHQLSAEEKQVEERIDHLSGHLKAIEAGESQAVCPTCRRTYDPKEKGRAVAELNAELTQTRQRAKDLVKELDAAKREGTRARAAVKQRNALLSQRATLAIDPKQALLPLDKKLAELASAREEAEARIAKTKNRIAELDDELPRLRERQQSLSELLHQKRDLDGRRQTAEKRAAELTEEISELSANRYDAKHHAEVKKELSAAEAAAQDCAVLRGKSDGLGMLKRRLAGEDKKTESAKAEREKLDAAASESAIDEEKVTASIRKCDKTEAEVSKAQDALGEAKLRARTDSDAVSAAHARLKEARKQHGELTKHRRELLLRSELADALDDYREEASRRARPTLEKETGHLLGRVTNGRYGAVALTDTYQLEVVDGRAQYPLRRFSGGEQDLTALCLRLALSRVLAHQRGTYTGFVLLDEVFGSQDHDRRSTLLEQLHALTESEFRQIFVVSHVNEVVDHCQMAIEVRLVDGVSVATPAGSI